MKDREHRTLYGPTPRACQCPCGGEAMTKYTDTAKEPDISSVVVCSKCGKGPDLEVTFGRAPIIEARKLIFAWNDYHGQADE